MSRKSISQRRRLSGDYSSIPDALFKSDAYKSLRSQARDILMFIIFQYNGDNNGDLTCTYEGGVLRSWNISIGKRHFQECLKELIDKGLIIKTTQGGRHKPSRFALAIYAIDNGGELSKATGKAPAKFLSWKDNKINITGSVSAPISINKGSPAHL